jgi:hypothetical protein
VKLTALCLMTLALACLACASNPGSQDKTASPKGHKTFFGVEDLPCGEVEKQAARALGKDPELGLAGKQAVADGVKLLLPRRIDPSDKQLRWEGYVLLKCFGATSSRLSVEIEAQRKKGGVWQDVPDTRSLEDFVMQRLSQAMLPK